MTLLTSRDTATFDFFMPAGEKGSVNGSSFFFGIP
jgi:hypothetical protein